MELQERYSGSTNEEMALTRLSVDTLKLILFGGKGGVGKTTLALSTGLGLAEQGTRTLVISTDPAHSLSDSLGETIGDQITEVNGVKNLSALEINAENVFSRFKMEYEGGIKKIFDTSTCLDQEDIDSVFSLSVPGLDEVMGFKTIVDLIDEAEFDKYIVDTAPTGHALRLLSMPKLLDDWIKVFAKMRWKYRYLVTSFSGKYSPDEGDDLLLALKKTVNRIGSLLRDSQRCEFIVVTIPEDMAILETERLVQDLGTYGIPVKQLVMNNVLESGDCPFCRERRKGQQKYLNQVRKRFAHLETIIISLRSSEVKGIDALHSFKEALFQ
jgi:arsenite-transporting ATPase